MAASLSPAGETARDINVLPLIDVLLVLIIIFLMQFRDLIFIPAQVPPPAPEAAPGKTDQIVLDLEADGSLAINRQPVPDEQLETMLQAILDGRRVKLLFIRMAEERRYDDLVRLMDRARGAGVEALAWMPRSAQAGVR